MNKPVKGLLALILLTFIIASCSSETEKSKEEEKEAKPDFCDCVNKDYHKSGDKEACLKIEKELTEKLANASKEEKGEILMQINDCKVKGQYDND